MHTKETFSKLISSKLKLIRTEQGLSQEELCTLVGISKKTLIQIEKRRLNANWTTTVAICALFNQSPYLHSLIGDQPIEFIRLVAHTDPSLATKTLGGHVWWTTIEHQGKYRIQQNMVSQHYRILDHDDFRWFSTFDRDEAFRKLIELRATHDEQGDTKK